MRICVYFHVWCFLILSLWKQKGICLYARHTSWSLVFLLRAIQYGWTSTVCMRRTRLAIFLTAKGSSKKFNVTTSRIVCLKCLFKGWIVIWTKETSIIYQNVALRNTMEGQIGCINICQKSTIIFAIWLRNINRNWVNIVFSDEAFFVLPRLPPSIN